VFELLEEFFPLIFKAKFANHYDRSGLLILVWRFVWRGIPNPYRLVSKNKGQSLTFLVFKCIMWLDKN